MEMASGSFRQQEISRDHDLFGDGRQCLQPDPRRDGTLVHESAVGEIDVLRVGRHRHLERSSVLECAAHQQRVDNRSAVVGDRHRTRANHLADLGELLSEAALGDRSDRIDPREADLRRPLPDEPCYRRIVVDRVGVGHTADRSETARDGRPTPGLEPPPTLQHRRSRRHQDLPDAHPIRRRDRPRAGCPSPGRYPETDRPPARYESAACSPRPPARR
jgi:hypothetical protein